VYWTRTFCWSDKGLWKSVNTNQRNHVFVKQNVPCSASLAKLASPWPVEGQSHVIGKYGFSDFLSRLANWPSFARDNVRQSFVLLTDVL
jgi:transposase